MIASDDHERDGEVWWSYHPPADAYLWDWQKRLNERRSLFDNGELLSGRREDQIEQTLSRLIRRIPSSLTIHDDLVRWLKWLLDASTPINRGQALLDQQKAIWVQDDRALDDIGRVAAAYRAGDATIPARLERHYAELEDLDREARTHYARLDQYRLQSLRLVVDVEDWLDHDLLPQDPWMSREPDWLAPARRDVVLLRHWIGIMRQRSNERGSLSADVADYNESRKHWRFAILFG